ncbi:hypothetical protein [Flavobacterium agrisoli]|uniref:Phosphoribosylpyrophosphate synthetase n=1 Tax=Flavobacterium agrisoli TaxID=2793066 RepID=A0A934PJP2_9FLAO|nr:hypothetical protein [Flavobacterium agrisoli]MBK0368842.1 hypothetical protein [Flavobacterium agrisoli]
MAINYDKHEIDYINHYQGKGYRTNFLFTEGCLMDTESKYKYQPEEIFIVAEHRYEGMSNPDDMSVLYVIETANRVKGTYLLGYGPSADLDAAEFFKNIPQKQVSEKENINEDKRSK